MSNEVKITIEDWIKLPETQALERHYKELGMIEPGSSWDDFEIVPSVKAYESYDLMPVINDFYAIRCPEKILLRTMSNTLYALRIAAISLKVEGLGLGLGKLIIQDRMPITIEDDNDFEPKLRRIIWRGKMFRRDGTHELQ